MKPGRTWWGEGEIIASKKDLAPEMEETLCKRGAKESQSRVWGARLEHHRRHGAPEAGPGPATSAGSCGEASAMAWQSEADRASPGAEMLSSSGWAARWWGWDPEGAGAPQETRGAARAWGSPGTPQGHPRMMRQLWVLQQHAQGQGGHLHLCHPGVDGGSSETADPESSTAAWRHQPGTPSPPQITLGVSSRLPCRHPGQP